MTIKIFITNIEDKGEQDALLDGTCDICFEWGYYTQYLVSFCLLMSDGTVIQSTYGVMCFKVVKKLFVEQVENYWVDRHGNIRSNIELAQCIRDQFKSRDNLYVAVSPDVIKKIS